MDLELIPHPDAPPDKVRAVRVHVGRAAMGWVFSFTVEGAVPLIPPPAPAKRTDGLWKTTCFEWFVKPDDGDAEGYLEFNFSPSAQWAAYRFDRYRDGMRDLELPSPPAIEPIEEGIRVTVSLLDMLHGKSRASFSAVIEETNGHKSYWALAHPPSGRPDFHHPACFVLELPPASGA